MCKNDVWPKAPARNSIVLNTNKCACLTAHPEKQNPLLASWLRCRLWENNKNSSGVYFGCKKIKTRSYCPQVLDNLKRDAFIEAGKQVYMLEIFRPLSPLTKRVRWLQQKNFQMQENKLFHQLRRSRWDTLKVECSSLSHCCFIPLVWWVFAVSLDFRLSCLSVLA